MRFEVGISSGVVFANLRFVHSLIGQCLTFLVPRFGVSVLRLKCTKHVGLNRDVV